MQEEINEDENRRVNWTVTMDLNNLPRELKTPEGYVYAALFQNNLVKIGSTRDVRHRIRGINTAIGAYGGNLIIKVAYTEPHVDYYRNEQLLHKVFQRKRAHAKELFDVTIDEVIKQSVINHTPLRAAQERANQPNDGFIRLALAADEMKFKNQLAIKLQQILIDPASGVAWLDEQIERMLGYLQVFTEARESVERWQNMPEVCAELSKNKADVAKIINEAVDNDNR